MNNFYIDTIRKDNRFNSKNRVNTIFLLEPIFRAKIVSILEEIKETGSNFGIWETYRSTTRQRLMFKSGASQLQTVGVHHFGLACDIVCIVNGFPSWNPKLYECLGDAVAKHELVWGGDWKKPDLVHVQRCAIGDQGALFRGEWYPDDSYVPVRTQDV